VLGLDFLAERAGWSATTTSGDMTLVCALLMSLDEPGPSAPASQKVLPLSLPSLSRALRFSLGRPVSATGVDPRVESQGCAVGPVGDGRAGRRCPRCRRPKR
jgi:hypothetical protein